MEADNGIFCSSGTRRSDATVSVSCKRMSVGETCVKCGDISCCWICVSLTLRKWGVPACSLSDRRVYPASQTRSQSQSQSHTDTPAHVHTHTHSCTVSSILPKPHILYTQWICTCRWLWQVPTPRIDFHYSTACVNIPLMHSMTPHTHGSTNTKGLRVRVRQHGYSQVSFTIDNKQHQR